MPRIVSIDAMAAAFQPGERVYLPGSVGEPTALLAALVARPERSCGLRILTSAVPSINALPVDALDLTVQVTGLFMQPELRRAQRDGRYRTLPLSFAGFLQHVRDRLAIDTCVVHVARPTRPATARSGRRWSSPPSSRPNHRASSP